MRNDAQHDGRIWIQERRGARDIAARHRQVTLQVAL